VIALTAKAVREENIDELNRMLDAGHEELKIYSLEALESVGHTAASIAAEAVADNPDIQVLCAQKPGDCGRDAINDAVLNGNERQPPGAAQKGDRVIITANHESLKYCNGDLAVIEDITTERDAVLLRLAADDTLHAFGSGKVLFKKEVIKHDETEVEVVVPSDLWKDEAETRTPVGTKSDIGALQCVDWAWCLTIHKFQGSQAPVIIMPVWDCFLNVKNLIYTGLTRGQKQVNILGDREVLFEGIRNRRGCQRITKLAELLNPNKDWDTYAAEFEKVNFGEFQKWEDRQAGAAMSIEQYVANFASNPGLIARLEAALEKPKDDHARKVPSNFIETS
jgi:ATP-dependent exoDNAse (exonuclease V) alpha subunit